MSIKQWEIWNVDFNPTRGQEINKERPAIVINDQRLGALDLKIVVPITDVKNPNAWHQLIKHSKKNGLIKDSAADCFQLKSISGDRFVKKRGVLEEEYRAHIQLKLMMVLGIEI
ncbi:MAG: type II toxin-antitoxin system PemK/MazF family toxin [Flavobacteriales bacterium]